MADHAQHHVLVMNDAEEILELMRSLLEDEGYHVSTALHTLDLGPLRELMPDAIVLDLMFEGQLKGWHFLTMARMDRQLSRIPMILCTANCVVAMDWPDLVQNGPDSNPLADPPTLAAASDRDSIP